MQLILGSEYWSFALMHTVYIKNRIPHTFINRTPFEAITGRKTDLSNLHLYGCCIFAKDPGKNPEKLDHHTSNDIFLGHTTTTKNVYYLDDKSNQVKIGVYAIFDEAHFKMPKDS